MMTVRTRCGSLSTVGDWLASTICSGAARANRDGGNRYDKRDAAGDRGNVRLHHGRITLHAGADRRAADKLRRGAAHKMPQASAAL
jgi:hypothetical protein